MAISEKSLKNLIKPNEKSKEKLLEQTKKGGKKSAEVRKARKTLKEELLLLLQEISDDGKKTNQERMSIAILQQAMKGDVNAFKTIEASIGEKPVDNVKVDIPIQIDIKDDFD